MCGIVGQIGAKKRDFYGDQTERASLERSLAVLEPRGPDAKGMYVKKNVLFGQRMLRIFDQSNESSQPMIEPDLGLAITFNGAIYNYQALRDELKGHGYHFHTKGDTEVLLKAYDFWVKHEKKPSVFLNKLDGIFAFAIHDEKTNEVFIARDKMGQKPFFYSEQTDQNGLPRFLFASTPQALYPFGGVDTSIDPVGLEMYKTTGVFTFAPHTIFKGVKKLPHAHYMIVKDGVIKKEEPYWQLDFKKESDKPKKTDQEWADEVEKTLLDSIEQCLAGDNQEIGLFLSGGLDSMVILCLLDKLRKQGKIPKDKPIKTFAYGYEKPPVDAADPEKRDKYMPDEFDKSDLLAEQFHTDHQKVLITNKEMLNLLDGSIEAMSEPSAVFDGVARIELARAAKKKDCNFVLSGESGDETCAGYPYIVAVKDAKNKPIDYFANVFFVRDKSVTDNAAYQAMHKYFAQAETKGLSRLSATTYALLSSIEPDANFSRAESWQAAQAVEHRAPFVSNNMLDLAGRLPDDILARENMTKYVLRLLAERYVGKELAFAPKSFCYNAALTLLCGEFGDKVKQTLNAAIKNGNDVFSEAELKELADNPSGQDKNVGINTAWSAYVLLEWVQHNRKLQNQLENPGKNWAGSVTRGTTASVAHR